MDATLLWLLVSAVAAAPPAAAAPSDSAAAHGRVVRRFPPIEVRAPLHDLRSSQTVHVVSAAALRDLPVDGLAEVLALQPGVVVQGEELHVRGGRAGEAEVTLDGMNLDEPLRRRAMDVPLLALRSADLVSGAPEASYGGGLAGTLDLRTVDPGARPTATWRWQTDGGLDTRYDRVSARLGTPLRVLGLGLVTAADLTFDDTSLPMLRTRRRHEVTGIKVGWRAENRMLAFAKLAPVERPQRYNAQVLVSRQVHQPYDPAWSLDGWTWLPPDPKAPPAFSTVPLPGYLRYRAADHLAITDEQRVAALLAVSRLGAARRASASLGWLRTRTLTSVGGRRYGEGEVHRASFGHLVEDDPFHVRWGDYPLYRESGSDVFSLRGDAEAANRAGSALKTGAGLRYERVTMREQDWMSLGWPIDGVAPTQPLDSIRAYRAWAPGGYAYVQGRWLTGGLVMNTGLRLEYFTAGPQADQQTLPGSERGFWMLSPRLGFAYPVSVRDVVSLAYARLHQAPGRDFLYDRRVAISNRQPLGNPALVPATVISYEAALKHVFGPDWALQASVFYRDVYDQIGVRDYTLPGGPTDLRYENVDYGHALGFEWSVLHVVGARRLEAHYTWLDAWGNESRPEGDPYGPVRGATTPAITERPLSWDRRHSLAVSGAWPWRDEWLLSWSTAVGSPLPWTPKPRRQPLTDLGLVNSRRFAWTENTNVNLEWAPRRARGIRLGLEVRNLFDERGERAATVDGYPNPLINTRYDDYGAYRTETGQGGGAYWSTPESGDAHWVPIHDPRLVQPPRTVRASIGASW